MAVGWYEDPEERLPDELKNTQPYPDLHDESLNPEDLDGNYGTPDPKEWEDYDPTKDWE